MAYLNNDQYFKDFELKKHKERGGKTVHMDGRERIVYGVQKEKVLTVGEMFKIQGQSRIDDIDDRIRSIEKDSGHTSDHDILGDYARETIALRKEKKQITDKYFLQLKQDLHNTLDETPPKKSYAIELKNNTIKSLGELIEVYEKTEGYELINIQYVQHYDSYIAFMKLVQPESKGTLKVID